MRSRTNRVDSCRAFCSPRTVGPRPPPYSLICPRVSQNPDAHADSALTISSAVLEWKGSQSRSATSSCEDQSPRRERVGIPPHAAPAGGPYAPPLSFSPPRSPPWWPPTRRTFRCRCQAHPGGLQLSDGQIQVFALGIVGPSLPFIEAMLQLKGDARAIHQCR